MSQTPIVRPVSWLNAGVSLVVLAAFVLIGFLVHRAIGVVVGAGIYVALSVSLRCVLARHHRTAIRYCRRKHYDQAIPEFQKSAMFFRDHEWIDRFRAITMLSAAGMRYREMALLSLGFCYAQVGDGPSSRQSYEQCLIDFPDSEMAKSALRLMDAGVMRSTPR